MASNTVNDGSVVFGSLQLTIASVVFETDDLEVKYSVKEIVRTDSQDGPTGRVMIVGTGEGTATLMYSSSSVNKPANFAQFSFTDDGITYACTVKEVGKRRAKAGEAKIPITFVVNITGSVVTGTTI